VGNAGPTHIIVMVLFLGLDDFNFSGGKPSYEGIS
jgi:hypothetical protein